MALPENLPLTQKALTVTMADLSTASSSYVVSPYRGRIVKAYSVIANAVTAGDGVWTMEINGTAVTGVSVTVANSGSAAGDVDSGTPTALSTSSVNPGDVIEFISDGGCNTTCVTTFTVLIETD